MDLSTLKIDNDPVSLDLEHPVSGEKTGVVLQLVGQDSDVFKKTDRKLTTQLLKKHGASGQINLYDIDFDETESSNLKRIASCIVGWQNLQYEGKELDYSEKNAVMLVKELPWIRDQVEGFVTDRANFIKAS